MKPTKSASIGTARWPGFSSITATSTRRAPAAEQQVAGERQGAAGFEDVVDEQDVAPRDVGLDVAHHRHAPGGARRGAVARQVDELDLRGDARAVQRPQQVGGEHEGALQHRDGEEVQRLGGGDLAGEGAGARRDGVGVEEDADDGVGQACHLSPGSTSARRRGPETGSAKLTARSCPSRGGAVSRLRNSTVSPTASWAFGAGAVQ